MSVPEEAVENGYDESTWEGGNDENQMYRLVRNDNEKESRLIRTGTCSSLKREKNRDRRKVK